MRLIKGTLPSLFILQTIHKCPFCGLFNVTLFTLLCHVLLVISLIRMALELCPEVQSSVPKSKKAVMHLMEKIHLLDKLYSGMSYDTVGCEFSINESIIHIKYCISKQSTHKTKL